MIASCAESDTLSFFLWGCSIFDHTLCCKFLWGKKIDVFISKYSLKGLIMLDELKEFGFALCEYSYEFKFATIWTGQFLRFLGVVWQMSA